MSNCASGHSTLNSSHFPPSPSCRNCEYSGNSAKWSSENVRIGHSTLPTGLFQYASGHTFTRSVARSPSLFPSAALAAIAADGAVVL